MATSPAVLKYPHHFVTSQKTLSSSRFSRFRRKQCSIMVKQSARAPTDRVSRRKKSPPIEVPRKRTQVACEHCRKRKIKCQVSPDDDACETCRNANKQCEVKRVGHHMYDLSKAATPSTVGTTTPRVLDVQSTDDIYGPSPYRPTQARYQALPIPSPRSRYGSVSSAASVPTTHSQYHPATSYRANSIAPTMYGRLPGPHPSLSYSTAHGCQHWSYPDANMSPHTFHSNPGAYQLPSMHRLSSGNPYGPSLATNIANTVYGDHRRDTLANLGLTTSVQAPTPPLSSSYSRRSTHPISQVPASTSMYQNSPGHISPMSAPYYPRRPSLDYSYGPSTSYPAAPPPSRADYHPTWQNGPIGHSEAAKNYLSSPYDSRPPSHRLSHMRHLPMAAQNSVGDSNQLTESHYRTHRASPEHSPTNGAWHYQKNDVVELSTPASSSRD